MFWYQLKSEGKQMAAADDVGIQKLSGIPL